MLSWANCNDVYTHLSHHYILRRSIVVIVDTEFESMVYADAAMYHIRRFFEQLDDEDYFGFINLDSVHKREEVTLECKKKNTNIKRKLLRDISHRDNANTLKYQQQ